MGLFDWSNKGNNKGLSAGQKDKSSGDVPGTWWSRNDGSSGQSQSQKEPDGSVTYWQHDRTPAGKDTVTEVRYSSDGNTTITEK